MMLLGVIEGTRLAWVALAEAHSVSAAARDSMVFLFSFSTRVFLAVAFVQLDPFSGAFAFTLAVKVVRIVILEPEVHIRFIRAMQLSDWRFWDLTWPKEPMWATRRITDRVEQAVLAEILATVCVLMAFLGEEILFWTGSINSRLLSADESSNSTSALTNSAKDFIEDQGVSRGDVNSVMFGFGFSLVLLVTLAGGAYAHVAARSRLAASRARFMAKVMTALSRFARLATMRRRMVALAVSQMSQGGVDPRSFSGPVGRALSQHDGSPMDVLWAGTSLAGASALSSEGQAYSGGVHDGSMNGSVPAAESAGGGLTVEG